MVFERQEHMPEMEQKILHVLAFFSLLFLAVKGQSAACIGTDARPGTVDGAYWIGDSFPFTNRTECIAACCDYTPAGCGAVMLAPEGECTLLRPFPISQAVNPHGNAWIYFVVRDPVEYYLDVQIHESGSTQCSTRIPQYRSYPIDACLPYDGLAYSDHTYHLYEIESLHDPGNFTVRHLVWYEAPGCTVPRGDRPPPSVAEVEGFGCNGRNYYSALKSTPFVIPDTAVTVPDTYQPAYVYWRKYADLSCQLGPPQQVSYALGRCYPEESLASSFRFERTVSDPEQGYQMAVAWWDGSIDCSGNVSEVFNVTWGCRDSGTGRGYYTFSADPMSRVCNFTTTAAYRSMKVSDQYQLATVPNASTWDACFQACCSNFFCQAFAISSTDCILYSGFPGDAVEPNALYTLYYMIQNNKTDPVLFLEVSSYANSDCSGGVVSSYTLPIEYCTTYSELAYSDHAYQTLSIELFSSNSAFALRRKVWFEAPGCTAVLGQRSPPNMDQQLLSTVCYDGTMYASLSYAPSSVPPNPPALTLDTYEPLFVNWRRYVSSGSCSSGPPQEVSYKLGACHEDVGARSSFRFERTATHSQEGYQMAVSWWSDSTACDTAAASMFNITWGCRDGSPAWGYFTFDSIPTPPICNATSTVGRRNTAVAVSYVIDVPLVDTWDNCFEVCCNNPDCFAFTLTTNFVCNLYRNFSDSATRVDSTSTLYYMVRDGLLAPPGYVDLRSYNNIGCTGAVSSYQSIHAGYCVPYGGLQYSDHAYQLLYFASYDGISTYTLHHHVWFTAPGCTVGPEEWGTPDIDTTRMAGDCEGGVNFWTAQYAPYTNNVSQIVRERDDFVPLFANQVEYQSLTSCTSPAVQSVSYKLGICYAQGTASLLVERTLNHPLFGYQMNISQWYNSSTCDGLPGALMAVVWGCNDQYGGSFTFTEVPEYPIYEFVESSSVMPMSTASISSTMMGFEVESSSMQVEFSPSASRSSLSSPRVEVTFGITSIVPSPLFSSLLVAFETSSFLSPETAMLKSSALPSVSFLTPMSDSSSQTLDDSVAQMTPVPTVFNTVRSSSFESRKSADVPSASFAMSSMPTAVYSDLLSSPTSEITMVSSATSSSAQFSSSSPSTSSSVSATSSPLFSATSLSRLSVLPSPAITTSVIQSSSSAVEAEMSSSPSLTSSRSELSSSTMTTSSSQRTSSSSMSVMPTTSVVILTTTATMSTMTTSTTVANPTTTVSTTTTSTTVANPTTTVMSPSPPMSTVVVSTPTTSTATTKPSLMSTASVSSSSVATSPPVLDDSGLSASTIAVEIVVPVGVLIIILSTVLVIAAVFICARRSGKKSLSLPITMTFTNVSVGDFDESLDHDLAPLKAHLVLDPEEVGSGAGESMLDDRDMESSLV